MNLFKKNIKDIIKIISGYQIQNIGNERFVLSKKSLTKQKINSRSLLLLEQPVSDITLNKGLNGYLEALNLKMILDLYQIDLVLDVGANVGQFGKKLRKLGYKNKIVSFEPVSIAFDELLKESKHDNNWDVLNYALGSENKEQKIHVSEASLFSSFLESNEWCSQYFGDESFGSKEELVQVRRLEDVLCGMVKNLDSAKIFLKMDTQGYDIEVFSGLGNLSDKVIALQSEISVIPIYHNIPHLTESIGFFEKAGFEISGLHPVNLEDTSLRVIEYDLVMVNSKSQNKN
jgi:FkbM family methyltransferase